VNNKVFSYWLNIRWLNIHANDASGNHPSALSQSFPGWFRVLQIYTQTDTDKWEWIDIPIVNFKEVKHE
jgi:hypothetical protein